MQMTRIETHPTIAGQLVVWEPSEATLTAVAATPGNGQAPSYMQETHIGLRKAMEREAKQDASWIGFAYDLDAPIDIDAMGRAVTAWVRRHGVLQGWFHDTGDGYERHQMRPEDITFVPRVVGQAATEAEAREFVATYVDSRCHPMDRLGYGFAAVIGDDGSVMYGGQDHTYSDGFSILIAYEEVSVLYATELGADPVELPAVGSYLDYAVQEREEAQGVDREHPAVAHWMNFAMKDLTGVPRFPMDLGIDKGDKRPIKPLRVDLLSEAESDALEAIAREGDATFPALVYAACALAARDLAGRSSYRFFNPVSTRTTAERFFSMGWYINVMPIHLDVPADASLLDVARTTRAAFREGKVSQQVPAVRVLEVLSEMFGFDANSTDRPRIVSYLDGRKIPGQDQWLERRFFGLTGGGYDDDVNVWLNRMPAHTYVTCSIPDTEVAIANVEKFFHYVRDLLRAELAAASGAPATAAEPALSV